MRCIRAWFIAALLACATISSDARRRFAVRYQSATKDALIRQLQAAGYRVVEHFDRQQAVAVVHDAHHESDEHHCARLAAMDGVHFAERDQERYLMWSPETRAYSSACKASNCKWKDKISSTSSPGHQEVLPYGIQMIKADDATLAPYSSTVNSNVLFCLVDGGADPYVEDFYGSSITGCTDDSNILTGYQCPYPWDRDDTGHGTHVIGTVAASRDGAGVIGVLPDGARIFNVKIFNGSCNPNYGCGPVYGSNLVEAFQTCEDYLNAYQFQDTSQPWRMVVSLSVGGPGPVTLEKIYFKYASERNDIMWVAASGNDEPSPGQHGVGLTYPAGYPEVISVAAVDCNETRAYFSQVNSDVELSAPGVNVLSDTQLGTLSVLLSGFNTSTNISFAGALAFSGISSRAGKKVSASGNLVDCGVALTKCTGSKGAICLVQRGGNSYVEKLANCQSAGGVGAVIMNDDLNNPCALPASSGMMMSSGGYSYNYANTSVIPSVFISFQQGSSIFDLLSAKVTIRISMSVTTQVISTTTKSGTSMATPHVSATAALIWSAYPQCTATDVRTALQTSAKHLGDGTGRNSQYGYGLVQVPKALSTLSKAPCAKPKAPPPSNNCVGTTCKSSKASGRRALMH